MIEMESAVCFECGKAAGSQGGCETCRLLARLKAVCTGVGPDLTGANRGGKKPRKAFRRPARAIAVGFRQLPPSDRE